MIRHVVEYEADDILVLSSITLHGVVSLRYKYVYTRVYVHRYLAQNMFHITLRRPGTLQTVMKHSQPSENA